MKNYIRTAIFFISGIIIFYSCSDEISPEIKTTFYQVPGCQNHSLGKSSNTQIDSCFSSSFTDKLKIDFCVSGNCCPDEKRFTFSSKILKDTITIAVTDTAANLCHCACNYIIHGEFESLQLNKYIIKCIMETENENNILYLAKVER